MKKKVLVTGANGFIGNALVARLVECGDWSVIGAVRRSDHHMLPSVRPVVVEDLTPSTTWRKGLEGVECVVHTAGRAHVLKNLPDAPAAFRRANVEGSVAIAQQAAEAGVKRFVYISSIGVNGSVTSDVPFEETMAPRPHAEYAISKMEAEEALAALCSRTNMELTIIRPPLVYSFDAPGNFARLLGVVARGWPLPFGCVSNLRSMISLTNLTDFISLALVHQNAANEKFLVADGDDVSLPQMIKLLGEGMNRSVRLINIPVSLLAFTAKITGRGKMFDQLCGSLQIDIRKSQNMLGWRPPLPTEEGLRLAGSNYVKQLGLK